MPIRLEATKQKKILKAYALPSPTFPKDRDLLVKIPNRKPVYAPNDSGDVVFTHWEVPGDQIEDFLIRWKPEEIDSDDLVRELIAEYQYMNSSLQDLPKFTGDLFKPVDGKTLKPYQEDYCRIDHNRYSLLCSFPMGTGKSLTTLIRVQSKGFNSLLIVAPKRVLPSWNTNIQNVLGAPCLIYEGTKSKRDKLILEIPNSRIVVTNYEMVRELKDFKFDEIIIDEIHNLSNPRTAIYKSCHHLLNKTNKKSYRQGLSGTPIRLNIADLYQVLKLIDPKFAGKKTAFISRYEKVVAKQRIRKIGKDGREFWFLKPVKVSSKNEDLLRDKLAGILVRVKREGIIDFEDTVDVVTTQMTLRQDNLYSRVLEEVLEEIKNLSNPLTKMLRLLQISEGSYTLFPDTMESGKMNYLIEELKDQEEKAVIWFRFKPGSNLLHNKYRERSVLYNGDVSDNMKKLAVYSFQGVTNSEDEKEFYTLKKAYEAKNGIWPFDPGTAQYFIGTYSQRSGLGIDLQSASLSYFMSFDFSPVSLVQAKDRIVRLNQQNDCVTKFLVSDNTLEPQSLQSILRKLNYQYSILDGKYSDDAKLTEELINILHSHRRS